MPQLHEVTPADITSDEVAELEARRDKIIRTNEDAKRELAYLRSKEAPRDVRRSQVEALVSGSERVAVDTTPARIRELQADIDVMDEAETEIGHKITAALRKAGNAYCQARKPEWDKLATEFLADCANVYRNLRKMDKGRDRLRAFNIGFGGLFNLSTEQVFGDSTEYGNDQLLPLLREGVKLGYLKDGDIAR